MKTDKPLNGEQVNNSLRGENQDECQNPYCKSDVLLTAFSVIVLMCHSITLPCPVFSVTDISATV